LFLKAVFFLPEDDELLELIPVFLRVAKKLVLKQLCGVRSVLWVFVKAAADEVLEHWRPLRILKFRSLLIVK
jgi:hypothetical protein